MSLNPRLGIWALAAGAAAAAFVTVAVAQQAQASGEVRRIDAAAGKITIKHGAIGELQLPAMTLVYRVDPALLQDIQAGDQVQFVAARQNDQYVILEIRKR